MDYVSTARRSVKSGGVANPQQAVMNAKRFHEMLHLVGLSEDVDWAEVSEEDFDQAIDDALAEVRALFTGYASCGSPAK